MAKYRVATRTTVKVIGVHLLKFKPILNPPLKNIVRRTSVPGGECASKTLSFSNTCKNLGMQHPLWAKIWSPEKVNMNGYDYTSRSPKFLDQSSPNFFAERGRNRGRSHTCPILNTFICSGDIRH